MSRRLLPAVIAVALVSSAGGQTVSDPQLRERCVALLQSGLRSDEFWPAMHAAEALTLAGRQEEVRAALEPRLPLEQDDQRRCGLARELVRAGDRTQAAVMLAVLAKADTYGHTHAAESLYKVAESGDGQLLRRALGAPSIKTRLMAAAALARAGDPQVLQSVRAALTGEDREGRKIAAWILTRLGDKSDIPQLRENAGKEADPVDKAYAEHALAGLRDAAGLAALRGNLRHDHVEVRTYAAEMAGYCRATEMRGELVRLLDDPVLDVRIRAAQSLIVLEQ
jgi:sialidase-1